MTDFYEVATMLTSLGIGEAAVTVLSPAGVPTPLVAVRLPAPDSLMEPIDPIQLHGRNALSPLTAKYGQAIDRESAHERISARLAAARAAAVQAAMRDQLTPTTGRGLNTMTPAQQRREIARQARELAAARRAAEREAKAQASTERRAAREQTRAAREQQRMINSVLRGVFGTILGGRRR